MNSSTANPGGHSDPGTITVLTAPGRRLAKLVELDGPGYRISGYDSARLFLHREIRLTGRAREWHNGLQALRLELGTLENRTDSCYGVTIRLD